MLLCFFFEQKSELELDFRRKESHFAQESRARESKLLDEKKKLEDQVQCMQVKIAQAMTKVRR